MRSSATASPAPKYSTTGSSSDCRRRGWSRTTAGYEARVIAPAGVGKKVFPNLLTVFAVGIFLSLLGGVGLAFLAEATDKSFRTLEEIRRRLGLPVMACIPLVAADAAARKKAAAGGAFDPMLITHYQPKSIAAEAYRGLRTALYFSDGGEGHKVVQFTSPMAGDGKSTVAANVAVSIAQSGKRTLLIDADLRKPRVHEIFSLSAPGADLRHFRRSRICRCHPGHFRPQPLDPALRSPACLARPSCSLRPVSRNCCGCSASSTTTCCWIVLPYWP